MILVLVPSGAFFGPCTLWEVVDFHFIGAEGVRALCSVSSMMLIFFSEPAYAYQLKIEAEQRIR